MRVLVVCPGRGSYDRASLGTLRGRAPDVVELCDGWRLEHGRVPVSELDAADTYRSSWHVAGENASLLTAACSWADWREMPERLEVVGVVGNSMGFYTALAVAGALPLPDAVRLVDTMGAYQEGHVLGGQLLHPLTGPDWTPDPARRRAVDEVLGDDAWWSIDLGSHAVIGATDAGLKRVAEALPREERGSRVFPLRLPLHSAFHTPLMAETSRRARQDLADLRFTAPTVPLVDGRGRIFRPRWADPSELRDYTLGAQVVAPFDFAGAIRTALRHTAPELVVVLGPGNSLGAPIAATLVAEGYHGVRTRGAFEARQAEQPLLLSFGVPEQRARLT